MPRGGQLLEAGDGRLPVLARTADNEPRCSWAYGKAGNGNKMETGNGNWKRKPETENRNGNATSSLL